MTSRHATQSEDWHCLSLHPYHTSLPRLDRKNPYSVDDCSCIHSWYRVAGVQKSHSFLFVCFFRQDLLCEHEKQNVSINYLTLKTEHSHVTCTHSPALQKTVSDPYDSSKSVDISSTGPFGHFINGVIFR